MADSIKDIDLIAASSDLKTVIGIIAEVGIRLSKIISLGDLHEVKDLKLKSNSDGDRQKSLDLIADREYFKALKSSPVAGYVSEEKKDLNKL